MHHSSYSSSSPPSSAPSSPVPVPASPLAGGLQGDPILITSLTSSRGFRELASPEKELEGGQDPEPTEALAR